MCTQNNQTPRRCLLKLTELFWIRIVDSTFKAPTCRPTSPSVEADNMPENNMKIKTGVKEFSIKIYCMCTLSFLSLKIYVQK